MKKYLYLVFSIAISLSLMGFIASTSMTMRFIIAAIAGLIGSCIAYYLFKNKKYQNIAASIIGLVLFFGTKNFLMPNYDAAIFETSLKEKYPIYTIISMYYPAQYNEFIEQMKKNIINHGSPNNAIYYSAALVDFATQKSIPFASSKSIYNYLQTGYQIEKKLYDINPILVLTLEFPERISQNSLSSTAQKIPEDYINKIIDARAQLIESGSKDRTSIKFTDAQTAQVTQTIQRIKSSLTEKYGKEVFDDTFLSNAAFKYPEKSAQLLLSFYKLILAQGEENSVLILKMLYMASAEDEKEKSN